MIDEEFILHAVYTYGNLSLDQEDIEQIPAFSNEEEIVSVRSVLLITAGHRPETRLRFSESKMDEWCRGRGIVWGIDSYSHRILFKAK